MLIEKYKNHVFRITLSVVHNQQEAEDLAQETFIKMMDALPSYQNQGFKTWLSRIALHKAIDYKRKKQRQREELGVDLDYHSPKGESVEMIVLDQEKIKQINDSIQQMPEKLGIAVQYYYIDGLSYTEIGQKLAIEEKAVEMRLYRARKWMKSNWKEDDF